MQGRKYILLRPKQTYESSVGNEKEASCLSVCSGHLDGATPSKPYRCTDTGSEEKPLRLLRCVSYLTTSTLDSCASLISQNSSWNRIEIFSPKCDAGKLFYDLILLLVWLFFFFLLSSLSLFLKSLYPGIVVLTFSSLLPSQSCSQHAFMSSLNFILSDYAS